MHTTIKNFALWIAAPCIISCLLSSVVIPGKQQQQQHRQEQQHRPSNRRLLPRLDKPSSCANNATQLDQFGRNSIDALSISLYKNGVTDSFGDIMDGKSLLHLLHMAYKDLNCPSSPLSKYQLDALLTNAFHHGIDGDLSDYCDMGPQKTPVLHDHHRLVPVVIDNEHSFLPCHFHTREGKRLTKLSDLLSLNSDPIHLVAVPAGRVFMFAPKYVGETFRLDDSDNNISLEVLSLSPRIFEIHNFISRQEADDILQTIQQETRDAYKMKRSSTGPAGVKNIIPQRTSENGFDTDGRTSLKVKKRGFSTLGFDEYIPSHDDGLQILRYNVTNAYKTHMDSIFDENHNLEYDYDSSGKGGNRFATILMYLSDLDPNGGGGETVFPESWPVGQAKKDRVDIKTALKELRASNSPLTQGSWEETMVATCRTRLAVKPKALRVVLFYSQHPNGEPDHASLHGACPVLSGQKLAANLWVWNAPRPGFAGAPVNEKYVKEHGVTASVNEENPAIIYGRFQNTGSNPTLDEAELYYEDTFWGKLGSNDPPILVNTYPGHRWNLRVGKRVIKSWLITESNDDDRTQTFTV